MYRCPNCSGEMKFSPEKQKLVCDYCGSEFDVSEFDDKKGVNAESHEDFSGSSDENGRYYQATVFTCPQCGGELISTTDTAATFCSFCGASVLLESRVSKELKPDYIIPFKKSKEECRDNYKKMLSKALFVPNAMKSDAEIDKFRSIYMPYWIYSFDYDGDIVTQGETSTRRGDYIYTRHYRLDTMAKLDYDGISFDASSSFADNLSEAVAPFEISEAVGFKPAYMTGHYADTKDTDSSVYEEDAGNAVKEHAASRIFPDGNYSSYGVGEADIAEGIYPRVKDVKLGFFPVWFLSHRSKSGDRVSYAVMNGQTGKIAADLPIAFPKYMIASLIAAVPIFLILSFLLDVTLTPRTMHIAALILGVIAAFVSNGQLNRVFTRDYNLDDKGFRSKHGDSIEDAKRSAGSSVNDLMKGLKKSGGGKTWGGCIALAVFVAFMTENLYITIAILTIAAILFVAMKNYKGQSTTDVYAAPFEDKMKILWKPAAGIVISVLMVLINPNEDIIQYAGAVVSMVLIAWAFKDIVSNYNHLTMRRLPQLGARGGDENA